MAARKVPAPSIPEEDKDIVVDQETGEVLDGDQAVETTSLANVDLSADISTGVYLPIIADSRETQVVAYRLLAGGDVKLSSMVNKMFKLSLFAHRVVNIREGNGYKKSIRTTLMADDGTIYHTCSQGVKNSCDIIRGIFGNPPYADPIAVQVVQIERGANRIFQLEPMID